MTRVSDRASGGWWLRAVTASLTAPFIGTLVGAALTVPILHVIAVELDRFQRFAVMLPGVVLGSTLAGALAGLAVGRRGRGLVGPAVASLVAELVVFFPILLGLWLDAGWVSELGWGADAATWLLQAVAILLALRLGGDEPADTRPPSARQ